MAVVLTLPRNLEERLQRRAGLQHRSVEEIAIDILSGALEEDTFPTPEEVVARIRATPPNPLSMRRATGSLADALRNAPHDPNFDLERWEKEWATAEAEMKTITRANDIAEGRG